MVILILIAALILVPTILELFGYLFASSVSKIPEMAEKSPEGCGCLILIVILVIAAICVS